MLLLEVSYSLFHEFFVFPPCEELFFYGLNLPIQFDKRRVYEFMFCFACLMSLSKKRKNLLVTKDIL